MPLSPLDAQLVASLDLFLAERPRDADEDVHMLSSVVDHVIERCTAPDEVVFDPFLGFGTTAERAIALGRHAIGIELLPERVQILRDRIPRAHVVEGDARELELILERTPAFDPASGVDLILTSPPYMTESHHDADPLTAYERDGGDYRRYLSELSMVADQCARIIKPGGFVVWNVADILHMGHTTHLIADCSAVLKQHLTRVAITQIQWERYPHDLIADALLVFQREGAPAHRHGQKL